MRWRPSASMTKKGYFVKLAMTTLCCLKAKNSTLTAQLADTEIRP